MDKNRIILYDGDCNLCNWSVGVVKGRDQGEFFSPVAFQSKEGTELAKKLGIDAGRPSSVVLVEDKEVFERSRAGVRILRNLKGFGFLSRVLDLLPERSLDWFYDVVARNRKRIFGTARQSNMHP